MRDNLLLRFFMNLHDAKAFGYMKYATPFFAQDTGNAALLVKMVAQFLTRTANAKVRSHISAFTTHTVRNLQPRIAHSVST